MRKAIVPLLLASACLDAACTHQVLLPLPVPAGARVEATLIAPGSISVHPPESDSVLRFAQVAALHGRVRNGPGDSLTLILGALELANKTEVPLPGAVVTVPTAIVARVSTVRLDAGGTAFGLALSALAVGLVVHGGVPVGWPGH